MKKTGRFISLLLALAIVLSLSVMALAANTTYSITIKGNPDNTVVHTYEAYQIFKGDLHDPTPGTDDGEQDKVLSNIDWGSGVDQARAVGGKTLTQAFDGKTAAEVAKGLNDISEAQAFAVKIAPYLSTHKDSNGKNVNGDYVIEDLEAGYYLVKDQDNSLTGKNDFYTAYMMQVVGNVQATPKGDKPTLKKQVKSPRNGEWSSIQAGYQIGETVQFQLVVSVPDISGYADYVCTIDDTMTAGLTSNVKNQDAATTDADATVAIRINDGDELSREYYTVAAEGNTFHVTIRIKDAMDVGSIEAGNNLYVYYTAKLNDNAAFYGHPGEDTSNKNTASLTYPNDPNGNSTGKTPDSIVKVWTLPTTLVKIEGTNKNKKLNGAKFVLSTHGDLTLEALELNDNYEPQASKDKLIAFVVDGETAPYEIATQEKINAAPEKTTYVIEIGEIGVIGETSIAGLGEKTYYLYEIKAPDGYNLLKQPIKYEIIMPEGDMSSTAFPLNVPSTKVDDVDNTLGLYIYISNNAGATLPETGGIGTTLFYVIGGLLVVGAGVLLVTKKRMGKTEN